MTKSVLKKKARRKPLKKSVKKSVSKSAQTLLVDSWATTEDALTRDLSEDLLDAWVKIREYAVSLGEQKVYASGKAIMFSKSVCYTFVRPKKSYLGAVCEFPLAQILNLDNSQVSFCGYRAVILSVSASSRHFA